MSHNYRNKRTGHTAANRMLVLLSIFVNISVVLGAIVLMTGCQAMEERAEAKEAAQKEKCWNLSALSEECRVKGVRPPRPCRSDQYEYWIMNSDGKTVRTISCVDRYQF